MAEPQRHYSLDDYFVVETDSVIKHEYYRGEIVAMAGASVAHNHIAANVLAFLRYALRGKGCSAFGSDLRVHTPGGLFTYPDVCLKGTATVHGDIVCPIIPGDEWFRS